MGGILLVDEAYYLYNAANDRDYGQAPPIPPPTCTP